MYIISIAMYTYDCLHLRVMAVRKMTVTLLKTKIKIYKRKSKNTF